MGQTQTHTKPVIDIYLAAFPDGLVDVPLETLECIAILRSMKKHGSSQRVALELGVSVRKIQYRLAEYRKNGWL